MTDQTKVPLPGLTLICAAALSFIASAAPGETLRPPATPLVAHDPYFSIWSRGDKLTDVETTHWTGRHHRLTSLVRLDGKAYRVMGASPSNTPALEQKNLTVLPTRTIYAFEGAGVTLTVTFLTAALPEDIDILSRPVTYVTYEFRSADGQQHDAALYLDASAEIAVNKPEQQVEWSMDDVAGLSTLKIGSQDQPVLGKKGDDLRIDWGYLYVAAPKSGATLANLLPARAALQAFVDHSELPMIKLATPLPASDAPVAALIMHSIKVSAQPVSRWLMLAYDDLYSIQYMRKNLRPYWRRGGDDAAALLKKAAADYESLQKRCEKFDAELMADLHQAGGEKYARLCALAYRQGLAGCKLVADAKGQPLLFPKENTSNGCIGTADVSYPMSPLFLLFGPSLSKAMLVPIMDYASSPRWKFPFAPHDLGTYPQANGQVYGGGERTAENQMPVEESANLLILVTALAQMEGNADFAGRCWPVLTQWAGYLQQKGFDPENQLCTDDFLGHLAHNVNLSAKAMLGLAGYARLCEMRGDKAGAGRYAALAHEYAARWMKEADDGDHFRLTFDKPGTWSQKYNLVWDRILGFGLFPDSVRRREMDYYRKVVKPYGVPLDNRGSGAKLDWSLWTATLTQNAADFAAVMEPVYRFVNETPQRVAMGDWYNTDNGHHLFMHSRPVIGGVFLQLLYSKPIWLKWARRDSTRAANWAPIPPPPKVTVIVPAADKQPALWRFTTAKPADDWSNPGFNDSAWQVGKSGFGTDGTPGAVIGTTWDSADIWLRREADIPADKLGKLALWLHHDDDAWIYVNGIEVLRVNGWTTEYEIFSLTGVARSALKPGKNLIAVRCHQAAGGQYVDLGLVELDND